MDGYLLAGGVFSGVLLLSIGILIGRVVARAEMKVLVAELQGQVSLKEQQLTQAELMYEELNEKERQYWQEKLALLDENKNQLKQEFENLANQIFQDKQKHFSEQSKQGLDALLNPLKDQLTGFRQKIDDVYVNEAKERASLKAQIDVLYKLNQRITDEASNLTKALKGDKKLQGTWGEIQVEMILEQSGLKKGREFEREPNFKSDDARNMRPDFIIHLPEGKHIIVDSKVSLIDYARYVEAETEAEKELHMKAYVQCIRAHIKGLSGKGYPKLKGLNSPDFVFMFLPVEPAFITAFEYDSALFNDAFESRIVVVTPTTLLATLRTVANLWSIEKQNQSARVLADQAAKVYDKLRVFVEKMDRLGGQLNTVNGTYRDAWDSLREGRGNLVSQAQKFLDLGVRVKKELPSAIVESSDLEITTESNNEKYKENEAEIDT
ncbi:DNA recombination protein RmuC [Alkalimarinus sediminis]|uniref:DNA recombination protein RmuC n=1 Tax=Alkalimarinus sediminis TaxID=1632866 RepID=A0A9E8HSH9_9ALTE|nr:DNA recombination protein RmuC [Alkalimarinus sediminis]UZW75731.1 DNA recombination protein RmuC [Alkalimarinus sediminis]